MSGFHPVFAQILSSICPPKTPPCPAGTHEWVTETDFGEVVCWFDHQPFEPRSHEHPGCPEILSVTHVWLGRLDLHGELSDFAKARLEHDALEALIRDRQEAATEFRLERWTRRTA